MISSNCFCLTNSLKCKDICTMISISTVTTTSCACNIFEEHQTFGSSKRWSHCVVITRGYFLSRGYISCGHHPPPSPPPPSLPKPSTAVSMLNLVRHYQNPASHQHHHDTHSALWKAEAERFIHDFVWIKSRRSFLWLWAHSAGISAPVSRFQLAHSPGVWSPCCWLLQA